MRCDRWEKGCGWVGGNVWREMTAPTVWVIGREVHGLRS